jgi:release factor glutamine methyltransferase
MHAVTPPLFTSVLSSLSEQLHALPDKPSETPESTLRVLWHLAAGNAYSVETAQDHPLIPLNGAAQTQLHLLIAQRLADTPLAHLTQRQRFMGLDMLAGPGALIPRPETELLAHAARDLVRARHARPVRVLDVCTGSGNLALSLAHDDATTQIFASDLSSDAIELAQRNAQHLGLQGRVQWHCGDLLSPFDTGDFFQNIDVLVCNPPYISSPKVQAMPQEIRQHEPAMAFDGGALGISILNRLIREAPKYLKVGGWLVFEVGLGQAKAVAKRLLTSSEYNKVKTLPDACGQPRVLQAQFDPHYT